MIRARSTTRSRTTNARKLASVLISRPTLAALHLEPKTLRGSGRSMRLFFRGERWTRRLSDRPTLRGQLVDGYCSWLKRVICVKRDLEPRDALETDLHE